MNSSIGGEYTALVVDDESALERYERWLTPRYDVVTTAADGPIHELDDADVVLRTRPFPRVDRWPVGASIASHDTACLVLIVTDFDPTNAVVHWTCRESLSVPVQPACLREKIARLFARARYDDLLAEYAELAVRRADLLSERSENTADGDDEFEDLTDRIEDVLEELETITADFDAADFDAAFETPDFGGGPRISQAAWSS